MPQSRRSCLGPEYGSSGRLSKQPHDGDLALSTLTKVFVVLLVLFSIAFTVMTVSVVAQTTNWKDTAARYEEQARIADTNLRHLSSASNAELAAASDQVEAQRRKVETLEAELGKKSTECNRVRAELAGAVADKTSSEAMNVSLVNQLQASEAARDEYRKQRDDLERRNIELERRNVDLSDRVNELSARVAVLLEEKRQFEQQINLLQQEKDRLSRSSATPARPLAFEAPAGAAMAGVEALAPVARSAIRGRVLEVSDSLVTLSVGSADGVTADMVFVIHRGTDYIGDVRINLVEPNRSAGRLVLHSGQGLRPEPGDAVTDAVSLAHARP
jgi:hypothetical protein